MSGNSERVATTEPGNQADKSEIPAHTELTYSSKDNRSDSSFSQVNDQPKSVSEPPPAPLDINKEEARDSTKAITSVIADVSSKRVQEAITQLTGQKFEPMKCLSLRSSANKNVKLRDLLFFNPPLTKDQKRHKKSISLAKKKEQKKAQEELADDDTETEETDNIAVLQEPSLTPKVKMGPDGKLVLDESSTVINRKNIIKEQEAIIEDNEEVISRTNYDSFRRRPSNTSQMKWSLEDTKKFYHALTILGTDFSMMESLLFSGHRSRTELHKKFKREERINKIKIDIALSNRISLNSEELDDLREIFNK